MSLVRATGVVALAGVAWGALMVALTGNPHLTSLQLNGRQPADEDAARLALQLDFVLLTLYGATFVLLGVLLVRRGGLWWALAGGAVIVGAVVTCAFDIVENVLTLHVLETLSRSALHDLRTVSYAKWTASAVTVGLVTLLFVGRGRSRIVIGLAFVAGGAALLGLTGATLQSRATLELYFDLLALLMPAVGVVFVGWPRTFLRGYR